MIGRKARRRRKRGAETRAWCLPGCIADIPPAKGKQISTSELACEARNVGVFSLILPKMEVYNTRAPSEQKYSKMRGSGPNDSGNGILSSYPAVHLATAPGVRHSQAQDSHLKSSVRNRSPSIKLPFLETLRPPVEVVVFFFLLLFSRDKTTHSLQGCTIFKPHGWAPTTLQFFFCG